MNMASSDTKPTFQTLPLELRQLIWELTLPPGRIFQVSDIGRFSHNPTPGAALGAVPIFTLHVYHSPPSATQVCRDSRAVALRRGFFLRSQRHPDDRGAAVDPGIWFNPDHDLLYFDCNLRYYLRVKDGRPVYDVPGWDRVLHIGVEWRAFFRDVPRFTENQDMRPSWRAVFNLLHLYMPNMKTLNYIIPATGRGGEPWTLVWAREKRSAPQAEAELITLPDDAAIPWETRLNPGGVGGPAPVNPQQMITSVTYTTTWGEVRKNMLTAFDPDDDVNVLSQENGNQQLREPPKIMGWWLVRRPPAVEKSLFTGDW